MAFALAFWNGMASFALCIALAVLSILPGFTHRA